MIRVGKLFISDIFINVLLNLHEVCIEKIFVFPRRTEQASSIKDLLLWLFTNLRTAKHVSISKCATKAEKGNKQFS